jgi:hypothetical protein
MRIQCGGREFRGTGYVERMSTTLAPWALPWSELRWGRAHVGDETWVWTVLDGPKGRDARLFINGQSHELGAIDTNSVTTHSGRTVMLSEHTTLRSGVIGDTVLSVLPIAKTIFPGRILGLRETKWRSKAASSTAQGYAIHELVEWPT